jgi:ABC-type glycerol-3-phosphate transport system substrate-binding protein
MAACNSNASQSKGSGKEPQGTVRILMEEVPDTTIVQKMAKSFEKQYPKIHIKIDSMNYGQMHDKAVTSFLAPKARYDVIAADSPWMYDFSKAGYLKPLDHRIKKLGSKYKYDDFFKSMRQINEVKGKTYGVPFYNYALGITYRKDLFKKADLKPPSTLDDYVHDAIKLTTKNRAGVAMQPQRGDKIFWEYANYLLSLGGRFVNDKGKITLNSDAARKALKQYIKTYKKAAPKNSLDWEFDQAKRAMSNNKAAMMTSYNWMLPSLNDPNGSAGQLAGKFSLAKFPGPRSVLAGWSWAIPKNTNTDEASWKFIRWITSPRQSKKRVIKGGAPVRESVLHDKKVWKKGYGKEYYETLQKILGESVPVGVGPHANEMIDDVGTELNKAVSGKEGVDQAISKAAKKARNDRRGK